MVINNAAVRAAVEASKGLDGFVSSTDQALARVAAHQLRTLQSSGVLASIEAAMRYVGPTTFAGREMERQVRALRCSGVLDRVDEATRVQAEIARTAADLGGPLHDAMAARLQSSIGSWQEALKNFGGVGLHQQTLDALRSIQGPRLDLARLSGQHMDAVTKTLAENGRQASVFGDLGATLASALEVPAFLRGFKLPTRKELRKEHRRLLRAAESLAKSGWTFPTNMSAAEIVALAEQEGGLDAVALDEWFVEYYGAERGREFRALASRLLKKSRLKAWHSLLRECLRAYRRGWYRLTIPALLAMIEGLVCEVTGTIRERRGDPPTRWRGRAAQPTKGDMVEIQWCVTASFLESLWCYSGFDRPAPESLNRHRVLHGRHPEVGGRADALRLLAAVDFIAEAARRVENMAKRRERKRNGRVD